MKPSDTRERERVQPPRLARQLLRLLLPADRREFIEGDLDERFALRVARGEPVRRARRWYWMNTLLSLKSGLRGREMQSATGEESSVGPRRLKAVMVVLFGDARQATRVLVRRPGFTTVAVLTLALGLGANTAVFSMVNHVLLRPLPGVRNPDRLVVIEFHSAEEDRRTGISQPNLTDLAAQVRTLEGLTGETIVRMQIRSGDEAPSSTTGLGVTGDYFGVLGVRPAAGRLLTAAETVPGSGAMTAVISESFWARWYDRDPAVVGHPLDVNGMTVTIVGVAGGGFRGSELTQQADVWIPLAAVSALRHFETDYYIERSPSAFRTPVGRLRPGVTVAAAEADLRRAFATLVEAWPVENERLRGYEPIVHAEPGLDPITRSLARASMGLMLGAVSLVLLIACANVANLLLFRGVHRRGETAVRRSLGASGARIAVQHLMEGVVLAVLGAVFGLLVAFWLTRLFAGQPGLRLPAIDALVIDVRVLAFMALIALGAPLLFAAAPAMLALRLDPATHLRHGGRDTGRRSRLRAVFAVLQISLSLVLLVGALLLTRTLRNLMQVEIGFDAARVHMVHVDPEPQGYDRAASDAFVRRVLDRLRQTNGIERASAAAHAPFVSSISIGGARLPGSTMEPIEVKSNWVSDDYFATLGIPVLRGDALGAAEQREGSTAVVISQSLARHLFGDADPIGRPIEDGFRREQHVVVGVVADVRMYDLADAMPLMIYEPLHRGYRRTADVVLRSSLPPRELDRVVREAVSAIDPAVPVPYPVRLADAVAASENERRMLLRLLTTLALLAIALATIGLYGLIAHSVAQRTREIGVRIALGARPGGVMRLVLAEAGIIAGLGVTLGLAGSYAFARVLENRLFGIAALDPVVWTMAALAFIAVTLLAAFMPTRSAVRVDPVVALRSD
jgi:predicted permease